MLLHDVSVALLPDSRYFRHVRGLVARVLLENAGDGKTGRRRLAQRDIATITGTDWGMVHMSLKSLHDEGAIRIDRHRLIINKELLRKIAESAIVN